MANERRRRDRDHGSPWEAPDGLPQELPPHVKRFHRAVARVERLERGGDLELDSLAELVEVVRLLSHRDAELVTPGIEIPRDGAPFFTLSFEGAPAKKPPRAPYI